MERETQFTLVTTAKNEAPYFLEWVAYHRLIGFQNIIIFQNDSDDGTGATLRLLDKIGAIQYRYNRAKRGAHQVTAYIRAARQPVYRAADWVMALDMDEFLEIKAPGHRLPDLIAALPRTDQVYINWRLFGSSGHSDLSDDLVTARFTQCDQPERVTVRHTGFKTLFRREVFARPGVHKPRRGDLCERATVNGSGLPVGQFSLRSWRSQDPGKRALAQVNHYAIRDAASFALKSGRGSAHQANRSIGPHYWRKFNEQRFPDFGLHRRREEIEAEMTRLDAAAGGQLWPLRAKAIAHHQAAFQQAMKDPTVADLYAFCLEDIAQRDREAA